LNRFGDQNFEWIWELDESLTVSLATYCNVNPLHRLNLRCIKLDLLAVRRVAHEKLWLSKVARHRVLEIKEVHEFIIAYCILVNLDPHHDCKIYWLIKSSGWHSGQNDALIWVQVKVCNYFLLQHSIEVSDSFLVTT
jgi:hypothetical protein